MTRGRRICTGDFLDGEHLPVYKLYDSIREETLKSYNSQLFWRLRMNIMDLDYHAIGRNLYINLYLTLK